MKNPVGLLFGAHVMANLIDIDLDDHVIGDVSDPPATKAADLQGRLQVAFQTQRVQPSGDCAIDAVSGPLKLDFVAALPCGRQVE